jgi:dipeptidyl aminopeptidase/acylaminoacyl peptidase
MAQLLRVIGAAGVALLAAACGDHRTTSNTARNAPAAAEQAAKPFSLLPRALLFGDPRRARGRLSPDGTTLAWVEPANGVLNIWTAPVDSMKDAQAITNERDVGVYDFDWLRNNTHIAYSRGRGGSEPSRVYAVSVITGEVRDLAPPGPQFSRLAATSWDYPDEVIVAANNDRDPNYVDLYRVNVVTGDRRRIFENTERLRFTRLYLDRSLNLTSASRERPDGSREIYYACGGARFPCRPGEDGWRHFADVSPEDAPDTRVFGYDGTNSALYTIDSRGRDAAALVRVDLQTFQRTVIAAVPGADITDVLLHPTTYEADAVLVDGLTPEWRPLTERAENAFRILSQKLRDRYTVLSRTVDDRLWVVLESGPTNPGSYHLFNRETEELKHLLDVRPGLPESRLAPMTPVIIKARDGLGLVSYLTLPPGADANGDGQPETPSPLVIIPEVGPIGRTSMGFDRTHQWLADRGYAALSVNVRGATGLGRAYRDAGDGEIGAGVQNDLRDAVAWAVAHGVADPKRVAVFGFLFGGHAALTEAAAPDTPFRCAASYNAPVDLVSVVEHTPPYFADYTTFLHQRLGDASDPATLARLSARSPINFATKIHLPTLISHGALDPSAQFGLAEKTAELARSAGAPATFVGLPDDPGDLLRSPQDARAFYATLEAFFANCLGGALEPIADDVRGGRLVTPVGAENIPQLAAALRKP